MLKPLEFSRQKTNKFPFKIMKLCRCPSSKQSGKHQKFRLICHLIDKSLLLALRDERETKISEKFRRSYPIQSYYSLAQFPTHSSVRRDVKGLLDYLALKPVENSRYTGDMLSNFQKTHQRPIDFEEKLFGFGAPSMKN